MSTHSDKPHNHTMTFTDETGKLHSFVVPCGKDNVANTEQAFHDYFDALPPETLINGLASDGNAIHPMRAIEIMLALGVEDRLGREYLTATNLAGLLIDITGGTVDGGEAE